MRTRRPARVRCKDALYYSIQQARLRQIADGETQPLYPREHYFLWTLQAGRRAREVDFIVPGLLFMAEIELKRQADEAAPDPAPAAP